MKKKIAFGFVILSLALAACGAAAPMAVESVPTYVEPPAYQEPLGEGGYPGNAPAPDALRMDTGAATAVQERLVIMNADLTIVVPDPQAKMDEIAALAESLGGFVVSVNMYQTSLYDGGTAPQGYISIRVPAEKMDFSLDQIKAGVVEVSSESRSGQDVTAEYVDLQSRLKALEAARDQLQTIMDNAEKTEDVLNVFGQLQYYNEQIEIVKGQMKYYEDASAYSLINVTLIAEETVKPLEIGPWTPKGAAQDAYKALIEFLRGFVEFLIWFFVLVVPVLIVIFGPIVLVIWLIVRGIKRSKARKQAGQ